MISNPANCQAEWERCHFTYKKLEKDGQKIAGHANEDMTQNYQQGHKEIIWSAEDSRCQTLIGSPLDCSSVTTLAHLNKLLGTPAKSHHAPSGHGGKRVTGYSHEHPHERFKNELPGLNRVYETRDDAVSTWLALGRTTGQP
nr:hypothetical protein [Pseudomonas moorei]